MTSGPGSGSVTTVTNNRDEIRSKYEAASDLTGWWRLLLVSPTRRRLTWVKPDVLLFFGVGDEVLVAVESCSAIKFVDEVRVALRDVEVTLMELTMCHQQRSVRRDRHGHFNRWGTER